MCSRNFIFAGSTKCFCLSCLEELINVLSGWVSVAGMQSSLWLCFAFAADQISKELKSISGRNIRSHNEPDNIITDRLLAGQGTYNTRP